MSSSLSLTISENPNSEIGREYPELKQLNKRQMFKSDRQLERGAEEPKTSRLPQRGPLDIRSLRAPSSFEHGELKRWNEPINVDQVELEHDSNSDDFYLEVDEKMSRNSYEYPEHQARYIERWLGASEGPHRSKSFGDDSTPQLSGNVVGIRGFSSESFFGNQFDTQLRAEFDQLKGDHLKLLSDYNKLRSKLVSSSGGKTGRGEGGELEILKSIVVQQSKQLENIASQQQGAILKACDRCRKASLNGAREELESMRFAKNQFALKLAHQEQEHAAQTEALQADLKRLRSSIASKDVEVAKLKREVENLSLEPSHRKLLALSSENTRLKEANEVDKREYFALKDDYARLEQKLRSLVLDQESLNNEQQEGVKEVLLELCRLQVYQPKLEMILETETQIRLNLQSQLASALEEKANLVQQVGQLRGQLDESKTRAISRESRDVERLREELSSWREKYERLQRDYSDLNELQRAAKSKAVQQSARLQTETQLARDQSQRELERAKSEQRQLKTQVLSLELQLDTMRKQLDAGESERNRLERDLLEAHRKLEMADRSKPSDERDHIRSIASKLEQSEQTISALRCELSISKCKTKDLAGELEVAGNKLEHMKQQYSELKRRFDVQQKLFDEWKDKRDKEVSKLRLDLNLEQYNRQVSLKSIEKELRSSLRELEAMKARFSKRLNPGLGIGPNAAGIEPAAASRSGQTVSPAAPTHR